MLGGKRVVAVAAAAVAQLVARVEKPAQPRSRLVIEPERAAAISASTAFGFTFFASAVFSCTVREASATYSCGVAVIAPHLRCRSAVSCCSCAMRFASRSFARACRHFQPTKPSKREQWQKLREPEIPLLVERRKVWRRAVRSSNCGRISSAAFGGAAARRGGWRGARHRRGGRRGSRRGAASRPRFGAESPRSAA